MNTKLAPEQINLILALLGLAIGGAALILALSNLNTAKEQVTLASEQIRISIDQFNKQQLKSEEAERTSHKQLIKALILELEANLSFSSNFLVDPTYYAEDVNSPIHIVGGKMSTIILEEALRSNSINNQDVIFSLWGTLFAINQVNGMIEDVRSKSHIVPVAYQQQKVLESLQNFSGPQIVQAHEKLVKYHEQIDKNSS